MSNGNPVSPNKDLKDLHHTLIQLNDSLSDSLDTITDPDLAQGVVTEMREVVHRIDLVQSLLFTAASNRISNAVEKVNDANAELEKSLEEITTITSLVKSVTNFLVLVDKAIDLAKTL